MLSCHGRASAIPARGLLLAPELRGADADREHHHLQPDLHDWDDGLRQQLPEPSDGQRQLWRLRKCLHGNRIDVWRQRNSRSMRLHAHRSSLPGRILRDGDG
jgi:hypothetical protein